MLSCDEVRVGAGVGLCLWPWLSLSGRGLSLAVWAQATSHRGAVVIDHVAHRVAAPFVSPLPSPLPSPLSSPYLSSDNVSRSALNSTSGMLTCWRSTDAVMWTTEPRGPSSLRSARITEGRHDRARALLGR